MNHYNVHLFRAMRLLFAGIEADSPEAAAAIARDKPTGDADGQRELVALRRALAHGVGNVELVTHLGAFGAADARCGAAVVYLDVGAGEVLGPGR